jgi:beta-phosphoglucomutase
VLQSIIFDADGVLLNASEIHFQALNRALATKGWLITQAEQKNLFDGLPTVKKLEYLTLHKGFPESWHHEILEIKQQLTMEVINDFIEVDPEKIDLIETLSSYGLSIGVASNMQQENLETLLTRIGILSLVDVVIGHDRVGYKRLKPNPDLYIHAATALGSDISVSSIVVDNNVSLTAAKAADPLDIVHVGGHEEVNPELLPRLLRFFPEEVRLAA